MAFVPEAAPALDCIRAITHYINKILRPRDKTKEISGMKCLLLDKETVSNRLPASIARLPLSSRTRFSKQRYRLGASVFAENNRVDGVRHERNSCQGWCVDGLRLLSGAEAVSWNAGAVMRYHSHLERTGIAPSSEQHLFKADGSSALNIASRLSIQPLKCAQR
jgi:hypothetical protein